MTIIKIEKIRKSFNGRVVLNDIDLTLSNNNFISLLGPSGSGKSTLLRSMAGLVFADFDSKSEVVVANQLIQKSGASATGIRRKRARIGFIFQQFNLVNRLSVLTNVLVGTLPDSPKWKTYLGIFTKEQKIKAMEVLKEVNMQDYAFQRVSTLSGGQQQRVAIAKILMRDLDVIYADEPVASLDPESSKIVLTLLKKISKKRNIPVIVALHQVNYAREYSDEIVALKNGEIFYQGNVENFDHDREKKLYQIK